MRRVTQLCIARSGVVEVGDPGCPAPPFAVRPYASGVTGSVALVGAGEFLPAMREFDRGLLDATGCPRPRVVIVSATSSPDAEAVFARWAALGMDHFRALGAEVEPILVRRPDDALDESNLQAIGEADVIYLSGARPAHLLRVLATSPLGAAVADAQARGAVVAGCSAGAMVLASRQFEFRRLRLPFPLRWRPALGLVEVTAVLPNYDAWPEPFSALVALQAPRGGTLMGIDEGTAVVGRNGAWQVHGQGRVTLWHGRSRERFRRGDAFRL